MQVIKREGEREYIEIEVSDVKAAAPAVIHFAFTLHMNNVRTHRFYDVALFTGKTDRKHNQAKTPTKVA